MWTVDSVDTGPVSLTSGFMELRNTKVWAAAAAAMIHPVHLNQASREQVSSRGGGGGVCRIVCSARVTCNNVI